MSPYEHRKIEKKWQKEWTKSGMYKTSGDDEKPKCYVLDMFPYPSGEGLHVGHPKGYIATDVYSRFKKMNGFNVLHPMGWDAFGLPAEQYAIKNKIHPRVAVEKNVARFKEQLSVIGFNYDWERELSTTDPKFYKWTQWIFLKLFEKGLAYESHEPINWCPSCQTGLANEDLDGDACERCGTMVEKKPMRQWVLRITDYAERLLADIDALEWPDSIKESQKNWIGKSEGALLKFPISNFQFPKTRTPHVKEHIRGIGVFLETPEGKFLFQKRGEDAPVRAGKISLFGGGREEGEEIDACLRRELKEELNLDVGDLPMSWVHDPESHNIPGSFLSIFHIKGVDKNTLTLNEGEEILEMTLKEALAHGLITDFTKETIQVLLEKKDTKHFVEVFTTRPDTLFGATFLAISAELAQKWLDVGWMPSEEIKKYIADTLVENASRTYEEKEKTGIFAGIQAINPANGEEIPVWVVNYVLGDVGTGAIMAVPAHDERDFEFARKYDLPIKMVICPHYPAPTCPVLDEAHKGDGHLVDSGQFDGLTSEEAKKAITEFVGGKIKTTYKLRDWVFSRQRYWGEPIPVIHCEACKNKKQKVLLLHGFQGSPQRNWMPWMKAELEARGFEVFAPELPNAGHPDMNAWLATILPILKNFTEEDIVIGHSLGSKAALHAIEKSGKKLKHAYLVASAIGEIGERDWEKRKANSSSDMDSLQKFWQTKTDYNAVSRLTNVTTIISDDDPYVPLKTHDDIPREWEFKIWRGFKHFQGKQSPELLEEFLRSKNTGVIPVPEKDLPVKLPEVEFYEPTGTGESPLANIDSWVNVKCPKCGGEAKRETNTMPQWAGSSWYYLRFIDPKNADALVDKEKEKYWSPVDMYVGGAEHATRHLIYARFWHKFLYDIGVVNYTEPFMKLHNVGLILAQDGRKMSKRWGNVVNPDVIVEEYGADTLRMYEMFMGPFEQSVAWSTEGIIGPRRFLERVWRLATRIKKEEQRIKNASIETLFHHTIKKVTEDIEAFKFNTAISSLMILANAFEKKDEVSLVLYSSFLILLAPFAPHITEELWHELGHESSIHLEKWPKFDEEEIKKKATIISVQVNGKLRAIFEIENDSSKKEVTTKALNLPEIKKWTEGKTPRKIVFVKDKLVSIVV